MSIPIIDFSRFNSGDKAVVAKEVYNAFSTVGFLVLRNTGVPDELMTRTLRVCSDFHDRDREEKLSKWPYLPQTTSGFSSKGAETLDLDGGLQDWKETLDMDINALGGKFPITSEEFESTVAEYSEEMNKLYFNILRCICISLDLDEDFMNTACSDQQTNLRFLRYPNLTPGKDKFSTFDEDGKKLVLRAGEHTDYGSMTLLIQDGVGGLQVRSHETDKFVDVPCIANTVVVNVADLLMRWSNDQLMSTPHRVVSKLDQPATLTTRHSIACFFSPNRTASIEALPNTYDEKTPKKYDPVVCWEFIMGRVMASRQPAV